jgi:hypothetical protein
VVVRIGGGLGKGVHLPPPLWFLGGGMGGGIGKSSRGSFSQSTNAM